MITIVHSYDHMIMWVSLQTLYGIESGALLMIAGQQQSLCPTVHDHAYNAVQDIICVC